MTIKIITVDVLNYLKWFIWDQEQKCNFWHSVLRERAYRRTNYFHWKVILSKFVNQRNKNHTQDRVSPMKWKSVRESVSEWNRESMCVCKRERERCVFGWKEREIEWKAGKINVKIYGGRCDKWYDTFNSTVGKVRGRLHIRTTTECVTDVQSVSQIWAG